MNDEWNTPTHEREKIIASKAKIALWIQPNNKTEFLQKSQQ